MTVTRVQTIRSAVAGNRPSGRPPGELYTNWPDNQLGVVNAAGVANDLLAVRIFSTSAVYAVGDYVTQAGQLYRAAAPNGPGAFTPANWGAIVATGDTSIFAPIASPVLTGDPKAPTPPVDDNDTSIATTAFVAGITAKTRTRFWSDVNNGAAITVPRVLAHRARIFVGAAVDYSNVALGGNPTFGWFAKATGPSYIARDGGIVSVAEDGNVGISGASRASDSSVGGAIGVAGFALADSGVSTNLGWAGYFEAIRAHAASTALGLEIDVRNCAAGAVVPQPWNLGSGPHGIWIVCGPGSGSYGPTPINHSGAAIAVGRNASGGNTFQFQTGLLFTNMALAGSSGADGETVSAAAISMARGQSVRWFSSDGVIKASIQCVLDTTDVNWATYWQGSSMIFSRNSGTEDVLRLTGFVNGANYLRIANGASSSPPQISAEGADTNVDVRLLGKGTGVLSFGTHAIKAAEAFSGYITIKDAGGNLRKLMVCA